MARILVVANETLGGAKLIEKVRELAGDGGQVIICVPRTNPRHGSIIYDEAVFDAAQVRVDLARAFLRSEEGIEAIGAVGDPDPYTATIDAVHEHAPDQIVLSTKPAQASGWLKRDLVERIARATGLPVEHVVTDLDREGLPFATTLVVANRTASTDRLLDALKARAQDVGSHLFVVVVPQEGGEGSHVAAARGRLGQLLDRARAAGLLVAGLIGDPDPYIATMNALQFFRVDDIIVSTLGAERSGWLRADVVERVRKATACPVEHVVADAATAEVR